jgi:hypothetical protein
MLLQTTGFKNTRRNLRVLEILNNNSIFGGVSDTFGGKITNNSDSRR